ncbi:MAG: M16 family metallopeptidase [Ilumatobacteraceae bacterium]
MSEHVVHLPSGLTVAVDPMTSTRSVSIGVWVDVGARDEPAEQSGISHFLEHLLFKGTADRDAIAISRSIDRVGGDINAFTSKEYTAYYCRVPARHADLGIELLGDVLSAPALRDDDVERERQVILEELAMDDDSPEDVVHREFAARLFDGHALGRDTGGERSTVAAMSADAIRTFFDEHYRTGNTVVAVAGAVDPDDVVRSVAAAFAAMRSGSSTRRRDRPSTASAMPSSIDIDDDTEQTHLVIGDVAVARTDPDREALDVANFVLGGGLSSRLFDEIRERRGLAYSVFSSTAAYCDSGAWSVYAGTMPEHRAEVEELIVREVTRLCDDGITDEELETAVGHLIGSYEMGLEDSAARMSRLGGQLAVLGEVRSIESQVERWQTVTHEAVDRVVRRVFGARAPLTVARGPG